MKCFLHIGTEKTGTTLVQEWLYSNTAKLSASGVFLSKKIGIPNNRKLCAYFQTLTDDYFSDNLIDNEQKRKRHFGGLLKALSKEIKIANKRHHSIVISSEHFSSRLSTVDEIRSLKDFLASLFSEIKIICYVREQSQLRRSLYSTYLKHWGTETLDNWKTNINIDDHYFNYAVMLSKWSDVFGVESIEAVIYDRRNFKENDIRKDFINRISSSLDISSFNYSIETSNESMSYLQGFLVRLINSQMGRYNKDKTFNEKRLKLVSTVLNNDHLKAGKIISSNDAQVYQEFNDANIIFFKKFFGVEENLFKQPAEADSPANSEMHELDFLHFESELFDTLVHIIKNIANEDNVPVIALNDSVVELFRDIALKLDKRSIISKDEALRLMMIARLGRPNGPAINEFINRLRDFK